MPGDAAWLRMSSDLPPPRRFSSDIRTESEQHRQRRGSSPGPVGSACSRLGREVCSNRDSTAAMVVRQPGPVTPGAAVIDSGSLFRLPGKGQQQWRPSASAHYERGSRRPSPSFSKSTPEGAILAKCLEQVLCRLDVRPFAPAG